MTEFNPFQELEKLLGHSEIGSTASFPSSSRYRAIPTTTLSLSDGTVIVYLKRRFVPLPESFAVQFDYTVEQNDRLDRMSFRFLSDPELYWRLCDANGTLNPEELEADGSIVHVPYPEGIPAPKTMT